MAIEEIRTRGRQITSRAHDATKVTAVEEKRFRKKVQVDGREEPRFCDYQPYASDSRGATDCLGDQGGWV